jgi:FlaG/FlaF family flagellin (archaellin)
VGAIMVMITLMIAGCSSSSTAGRSTTTLGPAQTAAGTSSTTSTDSTSSTTSSQAVNVPVSDQIRAQLVDAGAALNKISISEYTGLAPGLTYYAFDRATGTYWAGARLVPAPSRDPANPTQAQVASQDAGSYFLFSQPQGGSWTAYAAGNVGPEAPCPTTVPSEVLAVWGWPSGSCRPTGA